MEDSDLREMARPIWQALQDKFYREFPVVEAAMQDYLDAGDMKGLRTYINDYVFQASEHAYQQAVSIINGERLAVQEDPQ